jgi:hypothetical protein
LLGFKHKSRPIPQGKLHGTKLKIYIT